MNPAITISPACSGSRRRRVKTTLLAINQFRPQLVGDSLSNHLVAGIIKMAMVNVGFVRRIQEQFAEVSKKIQVFALLRHQIIKFLHS